MPRQDITPESRVSGGEEKFPKIEFKAEGEKQRIWCGEHNPSTKRASMWSEFVHNLRAAVIGADGAPVMEEVDNGDGTKRESYKTNWVGSPICLGDFGTLMDKGLDPSLCPACEAAERGLIKPPEVRYACNVVKYATRPGSFNLAAPFSAQVLAWTLTAKRYGKLVDLQEDSGPLLGYDLLLGPAEKPVKWQKYDIAKSDQGVAWRVLAQKDQAVARYIKELWNTPGNRATDAQLQALCGRLVTNKNLMLQDVRKCETSWSRALGVQQGGATTGAEFGQGTGSVSEGLDDLLADVTGPDDGPAPAAAEDGLDDMLAGVAAAKSQAQADMASALSPDPFAGLEEPAPAPEPAAVPAAPAAETAAEPTAPAPEAQSWDDILGGLEN